MATQDFASSSSAGSNAMSSSSYGVFISFRGEDTRNNFFSFLYKALKDAGFNNAFLDSAKLWTGEEISEVLQRAIKGSKISIPVLSKGYADSKWCLRELAQIVQCHEFNDRLILPIFCHVDPFLEHEKTFEPHEVNRWRKALSEIRNLKGKVLPDNIKDQTKLVESVVERALQEWVDFTGFTKCKYPIDMDSRVNELLSLLDIGSNDVRFVGICGSGGIGKTTLAKAVYNEILSTFHNHCFLSDIKEKATVNGLEYLQKQFLKDIFKRDFDIGDSDKGKNLIEEIVCMEKVFLVLDDVDSQEHIDALAGSLSWFGYGSRVIITTRDERILNLANVDEDKIYKPPLLDLAYSLQLFSWHAFQTSQPPEEYKQLSHGVVCHSGGIPLILEVFGSSLSCISNKNEWESTLELLREIPPEKVQKRLRISYDNLENGYLRAMFLDAACFFIGWKEKDVISIWEACGFHPKSALPRLIKRSLLKFEDGILKMHDCIRDMGREIVKEENCNDPSKRSRLWSHDDIIRVLEQHKGNDTIRSITMNYRYPSNASRSPIYLTTDSLEMMPNLRFLLVMEYNWNVRPPNEHNKRFLNLKILKFDGCYSLSIDFSWFPSLEQLCFDGCLWVELDKSIGQLNQLKSLILVWCISLNKLPDSIGDLKSLVKLDLSHTHIEKLPYNISGMSSLKELILVSCASLKKLPDSIGDLKSLVKLDLSHTHIEKLPYSISGMSSLKELILVSCKSLKKLPDSIDDLRSLVKLDLSSSCIEELPNIIGRMNSLEELNFNTCESLKKLPDVALLEKFSGVSNFGNRINLHKLPRSMGAKRCLDRTGHMDTIDFNDDFLVPPYPVRLNVFDLPLLQSLPADFSASKTLRKLNISQCGKLEDLPALPSCLVELHCQDCRSLVQLPDLSASKTLRLLTIWQCHQFKYLPALPSSLVELHCIWCQSLVRLPDLSKLKMLTTLKLQYCRNLEEVQGLEEIVESLDKLNTEGSYNLTTRTDDKKIEGILSPCNMSTSYSLTANQRIYDGGIILCLVLDITLCFLKPRVDPCNRAYVDIFATFHQKDKKIRRTHTLRIGDDEYGTDSHVIHISHFKGFTWFGLPLPQETDAIEILEIKEFGCRVKFSEVLFKNGDVIGTQEPCQNYPNTLKWSYMVDDGGVITLDYSPNQQQISLRPNSVFDERTEEEEDTLRSRGYRVGLRSENDHDDDGPDGGSCVCFCFHPILFLRSLLFRA